MTQPEYADTFIRNILGWIRWLGNQVTSAFQTGSGGGLFTWFAANWLKILLVLIVVGIVVDWLIWMVRWRPYWLWFRKKRVVLDEEYDEDDLDARDHDRLMAYQAYGDTDEEVGGPRFKSRALSRERDEDDFWDGDPDKTRVMRPRNRASDESDAFEEDFDAFGGFDDEGGEDSDFDAGDDALDAYGDDRDSWADEADFDGDDDFDEDSGEDFEDGEGEDEERSGAALIGRLRGLIGGRKRREASDAYDEDDGDFEDEFFETEADEQESAPSGDFDGDDDFFEDDFDRLSFYAQEDDEVTGEDDDMRIWPGFESGIEQPSIPGEAPHSIYARPAPTASSEPQILSFQRPEAGEESPGPPQGGTSVGGEEEDWHTGYTAKTPVIDADTPGLSRKARRRMREAEDEEE